jgi:hypothetical protein
MANGVLQRGRFEGTVHRAIASDDASFFSLTRLTSGRTLRTYYLCV